MHFTFILWIFSLLSTTVAGPDHEPSHHGQQFEPPKEGQVVLMYSSGHEYYAIFLGYVHEEPKKLKLLQFGHLSFSIQPTFATHFEKYFKDVSMRDRNGIPHKLGGTILLRIQYMNTEETRIPKEKVLLGKAGMGKLKQDVSVALVLGAFTYDTGSPVPPGYTNFPEKGRVVWLSSEIMYGRDVKLRHWYHFAICLGFADQSRSSKLNIVQIVMNLPLQEALQPERLADFNEFFQTTWWRKDRVLLDGDIDLTLHKIDRKYVRIPRTRVTLNSEGVKKLEHRMAMIRLTSYSPPRHKLYSLPANYHENSDDSGSEDGRTPETHLTRPGSANGVAHQVVL
ncbi:hypothetical protein APHAL10511_007660 [Amanita phalloides]|nr:hypothetical protein APHAL10511_007660 [Amanita phalloides]